MWYHLSYDIIDGTDKDYENLFKHIHKSLAYSHILKSSWVIKSNKSAETLRDELKNSTTADIRIMVTALGLGDAAFLAKTKIDYLVRNLGWKIDQ